MRQRYELLRIASQYFLLTPRALDMQELRDTCRTRLLQ
jgi:hypothetical protein